MAAKSYHPLKELVSLQKANFVSGRTTALQSSAERAGNILISKGVPIFHLSIKNIGRLRSILTDYLCAELHAYINE